MKPFLLTLLALVLGGVAYAAVYCLGLRRSERKERNEE